MKTTMTTKAALLAAALALAGGAAAAATADPAVRPVGTADGAGARTWGLYLRRGETYAVDGYGTCPATASVRDAGGRVLGQFRFGEEESREQLIAITPRPFTVSAEGVSETMLPWALLKRGGVLAAATWSKSEAKLMLKAFAVGPPVTDLTYSALESKPGGASTP